MTNLGNSILQQDAGQTDYDEYYDAGNVTDVIAVLRESADLAENITTSLQPFLDILDEDQNLMWLISIVFLLLIFLVGVPRYIRLFGRSNLCTSIDEVDHHDVHN